MDTVGVNRRNKNHYIGQWKNGLLNGNGTMTWSNGNHYNGSWQDGAPKGNGTFRWSDGSFYVGVWSKDPKEQNETYYPSTSSRNFDWQPQQVFYVDLSSFVVFTCQNAVLPSQKDASFVRFFGAK
ncbi:PREDICTED: phosphatidylinositol 4-phosphate 5-kinase 6-like [Camelina sativa]|uniref:Phosphatidylinositol 4-phosphate 5-kinase 6-like n=1 Tax=Camelina sativa TaxID=90675 RepID=A0ABM1RFF1_CAMSA|nr:PREDICTED: phosphatidylinositol 4-phosphate 5-kinase 6-like [Camelina sativa]